MEGSAQRAEFSSRFRVRRAKETRFLNSQPRTGESDKAGVYRGEKTARSGFLRIWGILLFMMLSLAFLQHPAQAAQPKLNKTSITVVTGRSYKLKIKGTNQKVTWRSSNPYVAKVSGKGVVTGKHMGYTTISVKTGDVTLQCRVTVLGRRKEKPYIFCYEKDKEGKTVETGNAYNLAVMNGQDKNWTWKVHNTELATLYSNGNHLETNQLGGKYCQLVETFMGKPGTVLITAQCGSTTLRYNLVINSSSDDARYTQMRSQVISQVIRPGMSAQAQCLELAKWLSDYASYLVTDKEDYSLLSSKVGQCYHYAKTYDFLLEATGIPCDYISTASHAWNQVLIDGQWYNIDVTGFDTDSSIYPFDYSYFMVSDAAFWRKEARCVPYHRCTSTRYDFGVRYANSPWATGTWVNY